MSKKPGGGGGGLGRVGDGAQPEGDYYGPTVNLAARILKLAPMNGVVVPLATAEELDRASGIDVDSLGAIEMWGLAEPVELAARRRS